mmetsp:Transcript_15455/g.41856  ORF Transcript_15455/g.41856 Transcript_15455/m.41856 type:complete len:223 (+) Transcript_15455:1958-2626(+)
MTGDHGRRALVRLEASLQVEVLAVVCISEDGTLHPVAFGYQVVDASTDALEHARYTHKKCGLQGRQIIHQLLHITLPVPDGASHVEHVLLHYTVKNVGQRQVRQEDIIGSQRLSLVLHEKLDARNCVHHRVVSDHDTLWWACGATSVHDGAQVLWLGGYRLRQGLAAALVQQILPGHDGHPHSLHTLNVLGIGFAPVHHAGGHHILSPPGQGFSHSSKLAAL